MEQMQIDVEQSGSLGGFRPHQVGIPEFLKQSTRFHDSKVPMLGLDSEIFRDKVSGKRAVFITYSKLYEAIKNPATLVGCGVWGFRWVLLERMPSARTSIGNKECKNQGNHLTTTHPGRHSNPR